MAMRIFDDFDGFDMPPALSCDAGIDGLPKRLNRYNIAKGQSVEIAAYVRSQIPEMPQTPFRLHLENIIYSLETCADYLRFRHYYTVDQVRLIDGRTCGKHLLCPFCAIRRGSKLLEKYLDRYNIIIKDNPNLRMSLITFTVKNGDDFAERQKHLKKSVQTMLEHRRKTIAGRRGYDSEMSKAAGLVGGYEVTEKGNGYHCHIHFLVLHKLSFDYVRLQQQWLKITGDSHVLNVTPCDDSDPVKAFCEVFKYAVKFGDFKPSQLLSMYEVLRGQRQVVSAGLFFGVEVPESELDDQLTGLPYYELFYQYVHGIGYELIETKHVDEPQPKEPKPVLPAFKFENQRDSNLASSGLRVPERNSVKVKKKKSAIPFWVLNPNLPPPKPVLINQDKLPFSPHSPPS